MLRIVGHNGSRLVVLAARKMVSSSWPFSVDIESRQSTGQLLYFLQVLQVAHGNGCFILVWVGLDPLAGDRETKELTPSDPKHVFLRV